MGEMWPSHLATCKIVWNRYWYLSSVWLTEEVYWELCSARKVLCGRRCWSLFCSIVSPSLGVVKLCFVSIILHYPSAAGDHKSFTVRAAWRTFFHGGRKKRLLFSTSIYVSIFLLLAFLFFLYSAFWKKWRRFHFVVTSVVCLMRFICALRLSIVEILEWNGKRKERGRIFLPIVFFFVYIASWL